MVATGWPPRGGHGGTGAGSLIEPALSVSPPSVWRLGGMCGVWANKTPPAKTLILQGFEACVAFEAFVFDLDLETTSRKMMFYLTPVKQIESK